MTYLALARKWRPRTFADVVGQDHVVRALRNALARNQVHHAYLLAGTRGVGKTTLARVLAKALNCDSPVEQEPCGTCSSCTSIDAGHFIDLIEVDAASRTKVEQTRELLENVQYSPGIGRYKVYLIDEVHMLSVSSFNALLKTLEEPPPHAKFLLATTDPQQLPATVLSRCLQLNLKALSVTLIISRLEFICREEGIESEPGALKILARAADGSMRDALSLLDQALAYGGGRLIETDVAAMLGLIDRHRVGDILRCLFAGDAAGLLAQARSLQEIGADPSSVLDEVATVLQQMAVLQLTGPECLADEAHRELVEELAGHADPEQVQLWYQIAVTGRRDLDLAPHPQVGFEMALLRMLAFRPALANANASGGGSAASVPPGSAVPTPAGVTPARKAAPERAVPDGAAGIPANGSDWNQLVARLPLRGAALQLARSCVPAGISDNTLTLRIESAHEYLLLELQQQQLQGALAASLGSELRLEFDVVNDAIDTPSRQALGAMAQRMDEARTAIESDPVVQELLKVFGARLDTDSIRPLDSSQRH